VQASHVRTNAHQPVQVVSVQSLARRARPDVDFVIVDECHQQFAAIREWQADCPEMIFVGLSATPWARGMAEHWQGLVIPVGMQQLIDAGFLSPFRVYAPSHPDMSGVKLNRAGDFEEAGAGEAMAPLTGDVVATWLQRAAGLPTLIFAVDRAHAAELVKQFAAAGVAMGYCDANVDLIERQLLFRRMASGQLAGIVNIGTLTTGVDADVRCVVLARPTRSEMLFVQMIGRALRTAPGKPEALILDHADNHARLGFVTDIRHDALKDGKARTTTARERGEPMPKECGACGLLKPAKVSACPKCGFKAQRQSEVETQPGELFELRAGMKKAEPTRAEKQRFWSMALHVDHGRGKAGKLAKALYFSKYGAWPKGLASEPVPPDAAFLGYERSRRIAYAASKGAGR
jgi:DNA repair protein RadD